MTTVKPKHMAVTTFAEKNYEYYAKRMLETFLENWPETFMIRVYVEDPESMRNEFDRLYGLYGQRFHAFGIPKHVPELMKLKKRNENRPEAHGKDDKNEYHVMQDYVKFAHKALVQIHAVTTAGNLSPVVWLDADTVTHIPIPESDILSLLPQDRLCAYMGREHVNMWPETGFLIWNPKHPSISAFMKKWKNLYENDIPMKNPSLFKSGYMIGKADTHTFDYVRREFASKGVKYENLTTGIRSAHPFVEHPVLGKYMDHLKGDRKKTGSSRNYVKVKK